MAPIDNRGEFPVAINTQEILRSRFQETVRKYKERAVSITDVELGNGAIFILELGQKRRFFPLREETYFVPVMGGSVYDGFDGYTAVAPDGTCYKMEFYEGGKAYISISSMKTRCGEVFSILGRRVSKDGTTDSLEVGRKERVYRNFDDLGAVSTKLHYILPQGEKKLELGGMCESLETAFNKARPPKGSEISKK